MDREEMISLTEAEIFIMISELPFGTSWYLEHLRSLASDLSPRELMGRVSPETYGISEEQIYAMMDYQDEPDAPRFRIDEERTIFVLFPELKDE
ncbi:hypothetical protein ADUPG1_006697 [Aduncisulcus paluster]|uniref:Uncharacterized protein n=1 Tax=Aduncisulcus paluster TaxID=2918883 RepID=A0ABQ5KJ80_9EUKA|nr:hypothetical protein ADUPG1_006697 [Aduncisulcus paluster]